MILNRFYYFKNIYYLYAQPFLHLKNYLFNNNCSMITVTFLTNRKTNDYLRNDWNWLVIWKKFWLLPRIIQKNGRSKIYCPTDKLQFLMCKYLDEPSDTPLPCLWTLQWQIPYFIKFMMPSIQMSTYSICHWERMLPTKLWHIS